MAAYTIEGMPVASWKLKFAQFSITYGDYFRAMGIPLLDGRYFTLEDRSDAPLVIIVNQSMARHSWPGQRAVGKRMHVGNPKKGLPWATVVGVVADTRLGPRDEPTADQWYFPVEQPATLSGPAPPSRLTYPGGGYIALRSALPAEHMIDTLRSAVATIDPQLALTDVRPMTDAISNIEAPRRFNTSLIAAFACGALLLAVTGIYAVVAFSVSLRTQEIAIRMALGAQRPGIARLILIFEREDSPPRLRVWLGGVSRGVESCSLLSLRRERHRSVDLFRQRHHHGASSAARIGHPRNPSRFFGPYRGAARDLRTLQIKNLPHEPLP